MRFWHFFILILSFSRCEVEKSGKMDPEKIDLLIISGRNNHNWKETTPQLMNMYERSGVFNVFLTEFPDTLSFGKIKDFDVIVSNWTSWPEHGYRWPKKAEDGLMRFVEQGGGFVLFHAASATFYDWPEFQEMVGTTWGDSTGHGKIASHKIMIKDQPHPVTRGISDFWITDELWVNSGVNSALNILAESYSDPANSGRGKMEPVAHWSQKGKGRIFHNILGHNVRAMKNTGWKTLMLRGTEWVATGAVSIPVPASLSNEKSEKTANYSWVQTDTTFALWNNNNIIWQYNFNTIKGKPFFHPVNINNSTITWLSPEDHPWHLGIWHSWKFINGVNYWEYDRAEGAERWNYLGTTEIRDMIIKKGDDFSCEIELNIAYHELNGPDLLLEKRMITISSPDENGLFFFDYDFNIKATSDSVELNRTPLPYEENGQDWGGYAGLSVRFSPDFFEPHFINSDGSQEMKHGKPMAWKYYGLKNIQGAALGAVIFDHPKNLNHPVPWFMTDYEDHPFYYFSPAPIFNQPHVIKGREELKLKYRMKFYSHVVSKEMLDRDYNTYLSPEKNF